MNNKNISKQNSSNIYAKEQFKTRQQMAAEIGVCYKTFMRLLEKANIQLHKRALICPKDQAIILKKLGI
jgi:hypothetical protein